ncbi:DUF427 domain-containing protein [Poritiphilus flavus]|uniref:DUF427 domain-containing protein n=1 Tax=Poritiphilus flavus TaxID=2697053 RepID=A0A6L9ECS3_9FLAO|nr:DUF427 domain-containing protein [Poritiphilus flavus]NAS12199.1 DUF427 domain-containing protein [Poritiphilus flavus]
MKKNDHSNWKPDWLQKAREGWNHKGDSRPPFAQEPKKGQRSVWDFPRPPIVENVNKRITISYQDKPLADSRAALAVLETASPPTYYLPEQDIDMDMLVSLTGKTSLCEWKGSAIYWALKEKSEIAVAWSYPKPFEEFEALKHHLGFYPQHLDCRVEGIKVRPQAGRFYAGWITPDLAGPFKGEPGTGHW